jgi:ActR/RegA family two-component response regulator
MKGEAQPDIVLLGVDRRTRAPLRAQLIEDGLEVVATDTWPMMRRHLHPGEKPRLAIVDLQGLDDPAGVLEALRALMKPDRVIVLTALGSVPAAEVERAGFRTLHRPASIEEVAAAARSALAASAERRAGAR